MKRFILIFLFVLSICNCTIVQTQQIPENKPQPIATVSNVNNADKEIGYPRFTTSDKQYLGCWRSIEASEIVNYELKFFQLTEKTIQTSKMSKPVAYREAESNDYKDYFVLQTESENNELQPYLNINLVRDNEMIVQEFATRKDITDGEGVNYWDLKREDCEKITSKFKK